MKTVEIEILQTIGTDEQYRQTLMAQWEANASFWSIDYQENSTVHVSLIYQDEQLKLVRQSSEPLLNKALFVLGEETWMTITSSLSHMVFGVITRAMDVTASGVYLKYDLLDDQGTQLSTNVLKLRIL